MAERCHCGNDDCARCYPWRSGRRAVDEDDEYERFRQEEIDNRTEE